MQAYGVTAENVSKCQLLSGASRCCTIKVAFQNVMFYQCSVPPGSWAAAHGAGILRAGLGAERVSGGLVSRLALLPLCGFHGGLGFAQGCSGLTEPGQ
jgi:hypothetical protein